MSVQLIAINDINLAGAPFDAAMDAMIGLQGPDVEFTFFRGTTEELKNASGGCDHVITSCAAAVLLNVTNGQLHCDCPELSGCYQLAVTV